MLDIWIAISKKRYRSWMIWIDNFHLSLKVIEKKQNQPNKTNY